MLFLECSRYGVRSLLWGLPIGIAMGYLTYVLMDLGCALPYRFPLEAVCVAVCSVFLIVFVAMLYAVARLRKDNPIDAIRMDAL